MKRPLISAVACTLSLLLASAGAHAGVWNTNDLFTSDEGSNVVNRYSAAGNFLGAMTVGGIGSDVRGMAFDKDGAMYAVRTVGSSLGVTVLDNNGTVRSEYSANSYVRGNVSYGKIALASTGKFYVASQNSLLAFTPGVAQGSAIYSANQVHDVEILPNGNLLVLSGYALVEITPAGGLVRQIATPWLVDARGVEYDAANDDVYVSMLGYTGNSFQLMRLNGSSGALEKSTDFWYGDDLLLTAEGSLLAGSRAQAPTFFDQQLRAGARLGTYGQTFVAQNAVAAIPEPASVLLLMGGVAALLQVRRRRA